MFDAGAFKACQVGVSILDPNDGLGIAQHRVRDEARYAPVAIRVRMDAAKESVPGHGANGGFSFRQTKAGRHGIAHRFLARRYMPRFPREHGIVAVSRQSGDRNQADGDAKLKCLAIPVTVDLADHRTRMRKAPQAIDARPTVPKSSLLRANRLRSQSVRSGKANCHPRTPHGSAARTPGT